MSNDKLDEFLIGGTFIENSDRMAGKVSQGRDVLDEDSPASFMSRQRGCGKFGVRVFAQIVDMGQARVIEPLA